MGLTRAREPNLHRLRHAVTQSRRACHQKRALALRELLVQHKKGNSAVKQDMRVLHAERDARQEATAAAKCVARTDEWIVTIPQKSRRVGASAPLD